MKPTVVSSHRPLVVTRSQLHGWVCDVLVERPVSRLCPLIISESRREPPPVFTTSPTTTTPAKKPPVLLDPVGPCRVDQATCQSGECIPRDYICDGERDCSDGSDEFRCGTRRKAAHTFRWRRAAELSRLSPRQARRLPASRTSSSAKTVAAPSSSGVAMETTTARTTLMKQTVVRQRSDAAAAAACCV